MRAQRRGWIDGEQMLQFSGPGDAPWKGPSQNTLDRQLGVDASRIDGETSAFGRETVEKSLLICFEERHGGLGAVVAEVARLSMTASRRLQLAHHRHRHPPLAAYSPLGASPGAKVPPLARSRFL